MPLLNLSLIDQYKKIHAHHRYGYSAGRFAEEIAEVMADIEPEHFLDYGCGRMELGGDRYDPAIPGLEAVPRRKYGLVVCTDVMEHIPEADIDDVLAHIRGLSARAYFNISTRPAHQILPDGRNAHVSVLSNSQWLTRVYNAFGYAETVSYTQDRISLLTWSDRRK